MISERIAPNMNQSSHLDLLTFTALLLRKRRTILFWTGLSALGGLILAFLWKPYYSSTAVIMPPQQQQSIASVMSAQIPQLAGAGSLSGLGLKNPGDMYVGIMQGETVTDSVIDKLHLDAVFQKKLRSDTRSTLQHAVAFESSRDGLIRINVKAATPVLAADIANAYVEALYQMNSHLAMTEAAQRRLFYQQQVDEERQQLAAAEDSLKVTQQQTGVVQLAGQTEVLFRNIEAVRSEITEKTVELRSMGTFDTAENPEVQRVQQELDGLRGQLAQLERSQRTADLGKISSVSSVGEVPAAGLAYLRKVRDVQYHENLYSVLSKQLEAARLDEAKSAAVLQVIDKAVPADRKAGPSRAVIVILTTAAGLFLSVLWLLSKAILPIVREKLEKA